MPSDQDKADLDLARRLRESGLKITAATIERLIRERDEARAEVRQRFANATRD